jgi:aminoglycoside phosphotransferase (APT) family kinase protein
MSARPRTSTRDSIELMPRLAEWLGAQANDRRPVEVYDITAPQGAGFSGDTVMFKAVRGRDRQAGMGSYVLRLPPPEDAFPLFPRYDLARQVEAMRLVAAHSDVPVPRIRWFEPTGTALGAPFFVMDAIDGEPMPDLPPYVMGGWVVDAQPAEHTRMLSGAVQVLAGIHRIRAEAGNLDAIALDVPGSTALERHVENQRRYYDWIRGDARFRTIDDTFAWLDDHWPVEHGPDALSWGDSRPANLLWRDFSPVAVLDWEAATVGPPELDLGWFIWFHEYFQRIAGRYGYVGAPGLFLRDQMLAQYAATAGIRPASIEWFLMYAELRQALTSIRVTSRAVHFGERQPPDDPEELIQDVQHLRAVVAGDTPI